MYRKFTQILEDWKISKSKNPLMVIGARQIGKTYTIDEFCRNNFKEYIYINLDSMPNIALLFDNLDDVDEITKRLKMIYKKQCDIKDLVIFIDEIQVSERAIHSLKYFAESKLEYNVICAGSLLRS